MLVLSHSNRSVLVLYSSNQYDLNLIKDFKESMKFLVEDKMMSYFHAFFLVIFFDVQIIVHHAHLNNYVHLYV